VEAVARVAEVAPDASSSGARPVETAAELARRMSAASVALYWNVCSEFEWPETLDRSQWFMPPELISLHGTECCERLDEPARRRFSFYELANFFSLTLQGERPLVQGLCNQMYSRQNEPITEYIHHFLDEENKHVVMFAEFCNRYAGKVYAQKKLPLPKECVRGEEDVAFLIKVLVVEEFGDYYNMAILRDTRVHPLAREINRVHHQDEARHILFGKRLLKELLDSGAPQWLPETLEGVRTWLGRYLRASCADFYSPPMYRDAGLEDAYRVREDVVAAASSREHRARASRRLLDYFLHAGILREVPAL